MKSTTKHSKIEYIIEYAGLPVGEHQFDFDIDNEFMQQYSENTYENTIQIQASITLIKHNHTLQAKVKLQGNISVVCDKCLIPYSYPIQTESLLLVQKRHPENSTDEILMVEENDNKINFSQYLYETISLALPYKIVPCEMFENVKCDEEVLEKIQKNLPDENKFNTFADLIKNKLKP